MKKRRNLIFKYIYTTLSIIVYIIATPAVILLSLKQKYRESLPARFFLYKNPPLSPDGVWFHLCSFGEARAVTSISDRIDNKYHRFTTTTQTGYSVVSSYSKESRYLPFEPLLYLWSKPQKVLVVFEAELWYLLFAIAKSQGAKTLLVNARVSQKSYPKYKKFAFLYREIFKYIDSVYAQTEEDADRLATLGAKNIKICGNLKFASIPKATKMLKRPKGLIVTAGSTHEGEEEIVFDAFGALKKRQKDAKLIIIPRHPERFEKVSGMAQAYAKKMNWSYSRYSKGTTLESDITLIDKMGESVNLYAISDIVILGGAFMPIGGHNAAEAAQFGCKIISGEHYFNQKELFAGIEGIVISSAKDLADRLKRYEELPNTKIKAKAVGIDDIVKEIESVL